MSESSPQPESQPSAAPDSTSPAIATLARAWQPITPRGIAAFSRAKAGRLGVVQLLVAIAVVASVLWFLSHAWFPLTLQAIRQLPETGSITNGLLDTPSSSALPLAENRFLAFFVDTNTTADATVSADFRIGFHHQQWTVCSLFGCLSRPYPTTPPTGFNRDDLEALWGAWEPMLLGVVAVAVFFGLFFNWWLLATVYSPFAWLLAYFNDRDLTLAGAWKLSGAALLAPALMLTLGIVLYGLGMVDLLRLLLLWALHIPLGWAALIAAVLVVPRVSVVANEKKNPFGDAPAGKPDAPKRPGNPFSPPSS